MSIVKPVMLAALFALGLFILAIVLRTARHDKDWADDVVRLSDVSREGDVFSIAQYRDWSYDGVGPSEMVWRPAGPYKVSDVRRIWLAVEPHPGFGGLMAHTMLVFQFEDGEVLGLSVEARKERGEPYGLLRGTLNGFELTYLWATPRDMFGRRVRVQDHEMYLYELALTQGEREAFLGALLGKTIRIQDKARFYNTFGSNCTNELAKTAGLGWRPAFIFTGLSGEALHKMGRLKETGDFEAVKARADVTAFVKGAGALDEADFNAALVRELDSRSP